MYFFVALAGLALSVGKAGAYTNYYLETLAAACILLGRAAASRPDLVTGSVRPIARVVLLILVALQLALLAHVPHYAEYARTPGPTDWQVGQSVAAAVAAADGPVLAENAAWVVLAGRPVAIDDPFFFSQLAREGRWSQEALVERIRRQEFALVLLEFDVRDLRRAEFHLDRFTPEMIAAIQDSYVLDRQLGGYYLLVPRAEAKKG